MTSSIRTFLLINLLLSITLITSLAIIADIFLEHSDLRRHLDTQLELIATTIDTFVSDHEVRQSKLFLPEKEGKLTEKFKPSAYRILQYQIWDKEGGKLILKPAHYKNRFLAHSEEGFSDKWINNELWRVFTVYNESKKIKLILAERYNFRKSIEARITKDSIFIMLATYPFLGLLIWIIVGRGLSTLKKLTKALRRRDPSHLKPFNFSDTPVEIQPLVNELNKLFVRLKKAFEREKRFASDAAHELRTPLAALRAQTEVALLADNSSDREAALRQLITGVDRSSHVVEQLLTLSRMELDPTQITFEPVDLVSQAQEVIALLVPDAIKRNIEVELTGDKKNKLEGVPTALSILIRNLVDNAIRYTKKDGLVVVDIQSNNEETVLEVTDTGPGVPEDMRERVFERFYRVLGTKEKGTGLGLGIVRQIVRLHRARISLDTPASGKGLKVTVIFPNKQMTP